MAMAQVVQQTWKQSTELWSKLFPGEQKTVQQSAMFVKKLLAVGLSSITYLRNIFPESSYYEQCLDGMKLKLLMENTDCRSSNMVVSWMKGCFQAIDQKYLRQLTFAMLNRDNNQEAFETYTYKFRYTDDDTIMYGPGAPDNAVQLLDTRRSTERMLRTIILLTQSLGALPKSFRLSMKLTYYDDVTPQEYEPPGFAPDREESFSFKSNPVMIKVGNVSTRFHALKLYVCVEQTAYSIEENTAEQTEEEPQEKLEKASEKGSTLVRSYTNYTKHHRDTNCATGSPSVSGSQELLLTQSQRQKDDQLVPTQSLTSRSSHGIMNASTQGSEGRSQPSCSSIEKFPVRCPCGVSCDDGLMVLCDGCQKWQHGACFNVLEDSEVSGSHICEECATPSHPCTDPTLPQQSELATFCLFRRALVLLDQGKVRISTASFAQQLGVNITKGNLLLQQLQSEKVVYIKRKVNYINRSKLYEAFPKYLTGHGNPRESQQTVDISSQTPKSSKSHDLDSDATPDLVLLSHESTTRESRSRTKLLNDSLNETVNIMTLSQDITIGTQNSHQSSKINLEASQNETPSEALATAGNTLLILDSPPASQKTQDCFFSMPLHSGMDVEEGSSELLGMQEPSKNPRTRQRKLSLGSKPKGGRRQPKRPEHHTLANDSEVSKSQDSDMQMKNSISQDSEIFKKRKIHK